MDSLQFQKAEYIGDAPPCAACRVPLNREYYKLAGQDICPIRAEKVREARRPPVGPAFVRALLFGVGAAVACCLAYAAITIAIKSEWAIIAIGVGVSVTASALVSPFTELTSGIGGILGVIIIGVGLLQACRPTAPDSRTLEGPFERQATAAPAILTRH